MYTFVAFSSQLIWLNFAGIAEPQLTEIYSVSVEQVGYLAAFWPLVFIPLSIPTGLSTDKWGFRVNVALGSGIIALFSWLRILAGLNFNLLLMFQTLAGIGQPFVYNGVSKLAGSWFDKGEQTIANGLGTMGQIAGMIASLVLTPFMVPDASYAELKQNMILFALISTIAFVLFVTLSREAGAKSRPKNWHEVLQEIMYVSKMRNVIILSILFFIGVGTFSGLIQWTESILESRGLSPFYGSLTGAALLVAGIAGMVTISYIADKLSKLRIFITANSLVVATFLFLFSFDFRYSAYVISAVIIGFFLLSLAPVGLQISLNTVGEARSGSAASIIWLASQVGALMMIVIMASLSTIAYGLLATPWSYSLVLSSLLMLFAAGISLLLKEKS
jgi:predicted MFS family arabinose efflux permease